MLSLLCAESLDCLVVCTRETKNAANGRVPFQIYDGAPSALLLPSLRP